MRTRNSWRNQERLWKDLGGVRAPDPKPERKPYFPNAFPLELLSSRPPSDLSDADLQRAAELALGRVFRMAARPFQDGDIEMFHKCKSILQDVTEERQRRGIR